MISAAILEFLEIFLMPVPGDYLTLLIAFTYVKSERRVKLHVRLTRFDKNMHLITGPFLDVI